MKKKSYFGPLFASIAIVVSGCASTSRPSTTGTTTQQLISLSDVPALKVTVDCGACAVKPSIPFLIIEGYNQAANNDGRKVSTTSEANLTIKAYTARDDAARLLFGAFAGKDEIKAVVAYHGKTYVLEDYYRNTIFGIDTLAKKIGEKSYAELK